MLLSCEVLGMISVVIRELDSLFAINHESSERLTSHLHRDPLNPKVDILICKSFILNITGGRGVESIDHKAYACEIFY